MLRGLVVPAALALMGAWVLVQPDVAEPPAPPGPHETAVAERAVPGNAIALLGEAWDLEPVAPVAPHAADILAPFMRPVPRPAGDGFAVTAAPSTPIRPLARPDDRRRDLAATGRIERRVETALSEIERASGLAGERSGALRWTVRRAGTGDVVAELPLAEALELLTAHRP